MRTVGELTLADVSYPAGARLPHHRHERAYFCLILRGGYTEVYGRRSRFCSPNTLVFHPSGEMHAQTFTGEDVASFNVEIGSVRLRRLSETGHHHDLHIELV
ncbi:MAG: hypothetical protein EXQ52_00385 [Bryobacterales bacterium]|nr:hypothetical protein [Bryobacterales bacterium]